MIDYEKYLQELGNINTEQKSVIKKYLEEQCQKDDALKSVYRPEKIDDCYDFIMNCARKTGKNGTSCIEDSIVFKMARDFYLEILPNQTDEPVKVEKKQSEKQEKTETVAETAVQAEMIEQENKNTEEVEKENHSEEKPKIDNLGFEVFGEEETAETTNQAEMTEKENENVSENPKYDEDGNGLFEF